MAPKRKSSSAPNPDLPRRLTRSATAASRGVAPPAPAPAPLAKRKPPSSKKLKFADDEEPDKKSSAAVEDGAVAALPKAAIVIEASKECQSFTMRSIIMKEGLESAVPGISVIVNPEKPRRGCFEIREEGGQIFLSLLGMKRPFSKMKELNMEEVVKDIVNKITRA